MSKAWPPYMKVEEFTDGEGYAPNEYGRWTCKCGWTTQYRMGKRTVSHAMSPESSQAYYALRISAISHASSCNGIAR